MQIHLMPGPMNVICLIISKSVELICLSADLVLLIEYESFLLKISRFSNKGVGGVDS